MIENIEQYDKQLNKIMMRFSDKLSVKKVVKVKPTDLADFMVILSKCKLSNHKINKVANQYFGFNLDDLATMDPISASKV
jgi:hypothetical protein